MARSKTQKRSMTVRKDSGVRRTFPQIGEVLDGKFQVLEQLNEREDSVSYKVSDLARGSASHPVYKTLKVFGQYSEVFHSLLEIRSGTRLYEDIESPSIPQFHQLHETEYVYYEFDYVDAVDLYQKLKKHISKKEKIDYAVQLADCLNYLHNKNIEHKDLKPENILIDKKNKLYLIDFETARMARQTSEFGTQTSEEQRPPMYTPEYCPPETSRGKERPFQRDIFAYGVILYEMFYGKYPFLIDEEGKVNYTLPKHLVSSNKKIDKIIKNCLQLFEEERYQSFSGIIDDLERHLKKTTAFFKTITRIIIKKIPFNNLTEDFKKDLRYLYTTLVLIMLLFAAFLYLYETIVPTEQMVYFDMTPHTVLVNSHNIGKPPFQKVLTKGDVITFLDKDDLADFQMTYNGEKRLKIEVNANQVLLNGKQRGLIARFDQSIPQDVKFVSLRGDMKKLRFTRLQGKDIHIAMTEAAPNELLSFIPSATEHLSFRHNNRNVDFRQLSRFENLQGLDLTGVNNLDLQQLPPMQNLRLLNISKTNTSNIRPINTMRQLRNLNLANNEVTDISPLYANSNLETIDLRGNNNDQLDFRPIGELPNLRQIDVDEHLLSTNQRMTIYNPINNKKFERKIQQDAASIRNSQIRIIIQLAIGLLLILAFFQMLKMSFKKGMKELGSRKKPVYRAQNLDPRPQSSDLRPQTSDRKGQTPENKVEVSNFQQLDAAIAEKRFYYPERNNALYFLHLLLQRNPKEKELLKKKKETLKLINDKVKTHLDRDEYEPVYLATNALNQYFPTSKSRKLFIKSEKELAKNVSAPNFIHIKGGIFEMGDFDKKNYPLHEVRLHNFRISETTVTNKQFCDFLNSQGNRSEGGISWIKIDSPYCHITCRDGRYYVNEPYSAFPVYEVSWFGAMRCCEWLGGRLPTEAEWEYAARSRGQYNTYSIKKKLSKKVANYLQDPNDSLWHSVFPVKSFPPNEIGLYEMSGNILEWCFDWYDKNIHEYGPISNPRGPRQGEYKVVRGGGWCFPAEQATTYYRGSAKPTSRNNYIGFRCVKSER